MKAAIFALALAAAAPAQALTDAEAARLASQITTRYVPLGLAADELLVVLRLRVSPYIVSSTNGDGTVTFWYERREGGEIVDLAMLCTITPTTATP